MKFDSIGRLKFLANEAAARRAVERAAQQIALDVRASWYKAKVTFEDDKGTADRTIGAARPRGIDSVVGLSEQKLIGLATELKDAELIYSEACDEWNVAEGLLATCIEFARKTSLPIPGVDQLTMRGMPERPTDISEGLATLRGGVE